jgi:hypothetical protein
VTPRRLSLSDRLLIRRPAERVPAKESENNSDGPSLWDVIARPAAALGLLTAALGVLAVAGPLERVQRDHPWFLLGSFAVLLFVGALFAAYSIVKTKNLRWWERILQIAMTALIGLALFGGLAALIYSQRESPRPRIEASVKTQDGIRVLDAKVKITGVRSDDHVRVVVEGLSWNRDDQGLPANLGRTPDRVLFYDAWMGADSAGVVDHTINIPLAALLRGENLDELGIRAWVLPSLPDACSDSVRSESCSKALGRSCVSLSSDRATGCVVVRVPRISTGPQLTGTWAPGRTAVIEVKADGVPVETGFVYAWAYRAGRIVGTAQLRPNQQGIVNSTLHFPLIPKAKQTCVVALIRREPEAAPPTSCPPTGVDFASWLVLPAPPK